MWKWYLSGVGEGVGYRRGSGNSRSVTEKRERCGLIYSITTGWTGNKGDDGIDGGKDGI